MIELDGSQLIVVIVGISIVLVVSLSRYGIYHRNCVIRLESSLDRIEGIKLETRVGLETEPETPSMVEEESLDVVNLIKNDSSY